MTGRAGTLAEALALSAIVLGAAGCEPAQGPGRATASLRLFGRPLDASVVVDGEALGSLEFVSAHGVALPPGVHHLTVTAPGYFPWDRELESDGRRPMAFEVVLTRIPD